MQGGQRERERGQRFVSALASPDLTNYAASSTTRLMGVVSLSLSLSLPQSVVDHHHGYIDGVVVIDIVV